MQLYVDYIWVWENGCLAPQLLPKKEWLSLAEIEHNREMSA